MMSLRCVAPAAFVCVMAAGAFGQIVATDQERSVVAASELGNGSSDGDFDSALNFGPFVRSLSVPLSGPGGAFAESSASQNTVIGGAGVTGLLSASANVATGSTFVTGQGMGRSSYLLLFSLSQASPVQFLASGSILLNGVNPDGEPSDLYGRASVRLINAGTDELVSGFTLFPEAGSDSASFNGMLPAGSYALLATAESFAFSADLLGPPARSGSGQSQVEFSLTVPSPSGLALLGLGGVLAVRRRR